MNERNMMPVIGMLIGVIVLVGVGIPVLASLAYDQTATYPFSNATMAPATVNGSTSTVPKFTQGQCGSALVLTSLTNTTAGANLYTFTEGVDGVGNYTVDAHTGVVTWTQVNTGLVGTGALATGTCASESNSGNAATQLIIQLIPLMIGIGALVYVVTQVL